MTSTASPPPTDARPRADWRGADLRAVNFSGCNLEGSDFRGADLRGINFSGCNLRYSDFRGALMQAANCQHANLYGAKMQGAEAQQADFRFADLRLCNFSGAYLDGAHLPDPRAKAQDSPEAAAPAVGRDAGVTGTLAKQLGTARLPPKTQNSGGKMQQQRNR